MSDTQTQISKIQLRRGPESDLPGEPTQDNPTQPTVGLDAGEMAFAIDTGRVYIGIDYQHTTATLGRSSFPYENIEVLTETSTDTFAGMVGNCLKLATGIHYQSVALDITSSQDDTDWRNLLIANGNSTPLLVSLGNIQQQGCATISYFMYDAQAVPMRAGKLAVIANGSGMAPLLTDESTHYQRTDLNPAASQNVNLLYGSVQFRAALVADGVSSQVLVQYQNRSQTTPVLMFRIETPNF